MTRNTTATQALNFKTSRDIILVNFISALFVAVIMCFPDSPARSILGLPFILFFPGYTLICALFHGKKDLDIVERLVLSFVLSIVVTSLMGLALNYTAFGIRPYSVAFSTYSLILLASAVTMYMRIISTEDAFAPLVTVSMSEWRVFTKKKHIQLSNGSIIIKIVAIIAFIFITFALAIIAKTPPASGYEVSIYEAYPWYFWVFILSSLFFGLLIQTKYIFSQKESTFWYIGLLVVVFTTVVYLLLPIFRGYYTLKCGDILTHLGYTRFIIDTSHIDVNLFYPIIHIIGTSFVDITNISLEKLPTIISILFYIIYIGSFYLLGSVISKNSHQHALITLLATPLIYMRFSIVLSPSFRSIALIPLIMYLYHKSRESGANTKKVSFSICAILVLFALVFAHPVTSLFMIVILLAFSLFDSFYTKSPAYIRERTKDDSKDIISKGINFTLISVVLFLFWYISYSAIIKSFHAITKWLLSGGEATLLEYQIAMISEINPTILEFVKGFVNIYGAIFMLLFFCGFCIIYWLKNVLSQNGKITPSYIEWVYVMLWILAFTIAIFEIFAYAIEYNPIRNIRLLILLSTIVSGLLFYTLIERHISVKGDLKKLGSIFLIFVVIMSVIPILNVYPSPRTHGCNPQMTEMEVSRFVWFANHYNNDIKVASCNFNTLNRIRCMMRMEHKTYFNRLKLLPHFGYNGNQSIAEAYDFEEVYILYNIIVLRYPYKYSEDAPYNENDISKLGSDPSVVNIYSNGEQTVWKSARIK